MIKLHSITVNDFKQLKDLSLRFPDKGSVLIEGRNEAGKSTLFEALFFALFGRPLLAETKLDDLIGYGCTDAIVALTLDVSGRRFEIGRTLRRGKPGKTRLKIIEADGAVEELNSPTTVNRRLSQELKLDADAFLNSCFVEQKKLEKLEGMTRTERETSLMRLLNLDQMQAQEAELKVRAEDTRALQRQEQRYRLAEYVAEIPAVKKAGREAHNKLQIIDLKSGLADIVRYRAGVAEAEARLADLGAPIRQHEERLARIESLRAAVRELDIAAVRLQKAEEHEHAVAGVEAEIAERDRYEAEDLPQVGLRARRLAVLRSQWTRLKALDDEAAEAAIEGKRLRAQLEALEQMRAETAAMEARLKQDEAGLTALASDEAETAAQSKAAELRLALEDWQAATHARGSLATLNRQIADSEAALDKLRAHLGSLDTEREAQAAILRMETGMAVACAGLFVLIGVLMWIRFTPWTVIALVPLVFAVQNAVRRRRTVAKLAAAAAERDKLAGQERDAQNALVRLQGQRENAMASQGASAGRLEAAVLKFESLDEIAPTSAEDAARRLEALPAVAQGSDSLRARLAEIREQLATGRGALVEQRKALAARQAEIAGAKEPALKTAADRAEARATRIVEVVVERWEAIARERAAALGVALTQDAAENVRASDRALAALDAETNLALQRLEERAALRERIERLRAAAASERTQVAAAWKSLPAVLPDAPLPTTVEDAAAARAALETEVEALDEPGTREALADLQRQSAAAAEARFCAARDAASTEDDLRRRVVALRLPEETELSEETLSAALPAWDDADPARREEIEAEFEELKGRNGYLTKTRDDLAATLNVDLSVESLDPETEMAAFKDLKRDVLIRERAVAILEQARRRIMNKVMPFTIEHMRRILPSLTMDRYHDAELTEDFKIRVWDERASEWKSKNIFSGGTRDQFSLALRLAFAMATLPQERGSAPSFIFLDEPLSSFDMERSSALMYLLTRGEVAETFDQIFVISHTQSVGTEDFDYRLRLEGGRITEPTSDDLKPLPAEPEQGELIAATGP